MCKPAEQQHPEAFIEYLGLSVPEKKIYCGNLMVRNNILQGQFDWENCRRFVVSEDVADVIIADMLYDLGDISASIKRARSLKIFKLLEGANWVDGNKGEDGKDEDREFKITSSYLFKLVLEYLFRGSSFWMTFRFFEVTKSVPKIRWFSWSTEEKRDMYICVSCADTL